MTSEGRQYEIDETTCVSSIWRIGRIIGDYTLVDIRGKRLTQPTQTRVLACLVNKKCIIGANILVDLREKQVRVLGFRAYSMADR